MTGLGYGQEPRLVNLASRLVVIGAMVVAVVAQGFYLRAATLTFWPGPGQSPTADNGLRIANATSIFLIVVAIVVLVVVRATALAVTMGVCALLVLINFGLWTVVGVSGMIAAVVFGWIWLMRSRRMPQSQ